MIEEEKSSSIIIKLNTDLNMAISTYDFFTYGDILAKIGGYKAIAEPIFHMFFPLLTLSYLHKLSRIIKQRKMKDYINVLKPISFDLYLKLRDD